MSIASRFRTKEHTKNATQQNQPLTFFFKIKRTKKGNSQIKKIIDFEKEQNVFFEKRRGDMWVRVSVFDAETFVIYIEEEKNR